MNEPTKKTPFWRSTTKIVFLSVTAALIWFTHTGVVQGTDFFALTSMVFAFYFGQKSAYKTSKKNKENKG